MKTSLDRQLTGLFGILSRWNLDYCYELCIITIDSVPFMETNLTFTYYKIQQHSYFSFLRQANKMKFKICFCLLLF